jgi:SelR domain
MKAMLVRFFGRNRVTLKSNANDTAPKKGTLKEKVYAPTLLPKYAPLFIKDGNYKLPLLENQFVTLNEKFQRVQVKEDNQYITFFKTEEGEQLIFYQKENYDKFTCEKINKFKDTLVNMLTPQQLYTTQGYGFERPFTGEYHCSTDYGMYICRICSQRIFMSDHKFLDNNGYATFWGCIPDSLTKRKFNNNDVLLCSNVYW